MLQLVLLATLVTAAQVSDDTVAPNESPAEVQPEPAAGDTPPSLDAPLEGPGEDGEDAAAQAPVEGAPAGVAPPADAPPPAAVVPPSPPAPLVSPEPSAPRVVTPEGEPISTEPPGMGPFMTRVLQVGAGCGLTALSSACCVIPWVGAPAVACLGPLLVTTTHVTVAETFGSERGTLVWPLVTAYAIEVVTLAGSIAALIGTAAAIGAGGPELLRNVGSITDPGVAIAAAFGALLIPFVTAGAVLLTGGVLMVLAPALVYGWTSSTKEPSDTDFRFPGLCSPNLPSAEDDAAADEDDAAEGTPEEAQRLLRGTRVANAMPF